MKGGDGNDIYGSLGHRVYSVAPVRVGRVLQPVNRADLRINDTVMREPFVKRISDAEMRVMRYSPAYGAPEGTW